MRNRARDNTDLLFQAGGLYLAAAASIAGGALIEAGVVAALSTQAGRVLLLTTANTVGATLGEAGAWLAVGSAKWSDELVSAWNRAGAANTISPRRFAEFF